MSQYFRYKIDVKDLIGKQYCDVLVLASAATLELTWTQLDS